MKRVRIGVLLSGSGTTFQAILDNMGALKHCGEIAVVISNKAKAYGLERARQANLETVHISHKRYDSRREYDAELVKCLNEHQVDWVILAGFMRILSAAKARNRSTRRNTSSGASAKFATLEMMSRS